MEFKRARTDGQKEQRIAAIIDATSRLYATRPFEKNTLVAIAKAADFSRSNLYKYFFKQLAKAESAVFTRLLCDLFPGFSRDHAVKILNMQLAPSRLVMATFQGKASPTCWQLAPTTTQPTGPHS